MNFKAKLNEHTTLTHMDGRSVLFSKKTGDFYGLNDSATVLVDELLQSDFSSTVKKSAGMYQVSEGELAKDLNEVVDNLLRLNLVVKQPC